MGLRNRIKYGSNRVTWFGRFEAFTVFPKYELNEHFHLGQFTQNRSDELSCDHSFARQVDLIVALNITLDIVMNICVTYDTFIYLKVEYRIELAAMKPPSIVFAFPTKILCKGVSVF